MLSSAVPVTSTPSPDDHQVEASAAGSPVRAAAFPDISMEVDRPQSLAAVDVLPTSKPTGGASDVAPVSGGVPGVSAEKVNVATSNSLEPTISTEKAITPSGSDEAANAVVTLPVPLADVVGSSSVDLPSHVHRDSEPGD